MKKRASHRNNIRLTMVVKVAALAAFLVFLWEDNERELYAHKAKDESVMFVALNSFSKNLGGSTEHWYSEGWPDGGRPLKK